jgi:hypothetical protein
MKKITIILLCAFFINVFNANAQLSVYAEGLQPGMSFNEFGGSNPGATTDDATVAHSGTTSLKVVVGAANYVGGAIKAAAPTNLSAYNALTFWVKASAAKTLNTAGIFNNGASAVYQTEYRNVAVTTTWTKVTIPIPNPAKMTAEDGWFHYAEGGDEGAYTLWFDDIQFENTTVGATVATMATETLNKSVGDAFAASGLTCTIGGVPLAVEPANFTFTSSNAGVANVSAAGIGSALSVGSAMITAKLGTTNVSGTLTVNVSAAPSGPTIAAPTPTRPVSDVISVFSNAYTDLAATNFFPNWGQTTQVTDVLIAGNATKKYANFNYEGTQFATPINASTMQFLHIDYWSSTVNSFDVFLINIPPLAQKEQKVTLTPTLSGWNSLDIPLSAYSTINLTGIGQFKLEGRPSGGIVYLDNIYFYKAVVAATAPTVAAPNPTRLPANVISLFSGVYTDVAGTDWFPDWGGQSTVVTEVPIAGNPTKKYASLSYQGVQFLNPINTVSPATMTTLHFDLWTSSCTAFDVSLINTSPATVEQKFTVNPTLSGWNSIDIPLTAYPNINLTNIGQFKLEGTPSGTSIVYLDNIYFWRPPVIPVELVSFKGKAVNNTTVLNWNTASERDNQGFTIERSTDATNYSAVGQVKGNGTTSAPHDYKFTDNAPASGSNYYRLRQTDVNGKETMSSVVSVVFGKSGGLIIKSNLVHEALDVTVGEAELGPLSIFNLSGQLMYSAKVQGTQRIDVSAFAAGMYIVRTASGAESRFVKQ